MTFTYKNILPKEKVERITIRLFDEEIEEAEALCLMLDLSYEQFFVQKIKEELSKRGVRKKIVC